MNKKENKTDIQNTNRKSYVQFTKKLFGIGLCGLLAFTSAGSTTTLIRAEEFKDSEDTDTGRDTWVEQSLDVAKKVRTIDSGAATEGSQGNFQTVTNAQSIPNWESIDLSDYQVKSIQPDNVTVNLFNYKVNPEDGENDAMATPPMPNIDNQNIKSNTEDIWNKGINQNSLLLFGNSMTDVGYWNNGAGAGRPWGKTHTNMKGIVNSTLNTNGYPQINLDNAKNPLNDQTPTQWEKENGKQLDIWGLGCADYAENANEYDSSTGYSAGGLSTNLLNKQKNLSEENQRISLQYLFDPSIPVSSGDETSRQSYKESYRNVQNLFQLDDKGYYYYDVRQNFAHFVPAVADSQSQNASDGTFVLYNSPAVVRTDGGYQCSDGTLACDNGDFNGSKSRGNFFPFNSPEQVYDQTAKNTKDQDVLWSSDEKTNEGNKVLADHHMGMMVEVDFSQPINGLINRGSSAAEPMKFEFSGDDDVWVFIDDVLVLDIGGIHSELYGTIDFSTGNVEIGQSWRTNGDIDAAHALFAPDNTSTNEAARDGQPANSHVNKTTLHQLFTDAKKEDTTSWNGNTFASNSTHKLKMFYLERGNYDSSLKLRFNLQTPKPHEIIKVDQDGNPLEGVEFSLYPAHQTTLEEDPNALRCLNATGSTTENPVYVAQTVSDGTENEPLATLKTAEDGTASFMEAVNPSDASDGEEEKEQRPFNFADRWKTETTTEADGTTTTTVLSGQYYILRETETPDGYRSLPQNIVLEYNPETTMLKVANRWSTGAHASFTSTVVGKKNPAFEGVTPSTDNSAATVDEQKNGLIVAVPALTKTPGNETDDWAGVYGTNLDGFHTIKREIDSSEKENLLKAALAQAYLTLNQNTDAALEQQWYLEWNETNDRLEGVLRNLPGSADRYALLNNENADLKMNYYLIKPDVFPKTSEGDNAQQEYPTAAAKYQWLGTLVQHKLEKAGVTSDPTNEQITDAVDAVMRDFTQNDSDLSNTSLLNTGDFSRTFRSLIYIPNEQRELRIQKIDPDGKPVENAEFAIYNNPEATGTPIGTGATDANGQLVFMPRPPRDSGNTILDGYAEMIWNEANDTPQYYLKETSAPAGSVLNETVVPIVVGTHGIYADAGAQNDGVSVMAGVGKLTQTMVKYASDGEVNTTLQDIIAICQKQPSGQFNSSKWQNDTLQHASTDSQDTQTGGVSRSLNLHYGINQVVDYGLHDEDGGQTIRPFFVTDTGFIRSQVVQNRDLGQYPSVHSSDDTTRRDDLGTTDLTSLFSLLNTVVITDPKTDPEPTGEFEIRKIVTNQGDNDNPLTADDYNKLFTFVVQLRDAAGNPLTGEYQYYGTDKSGTIAHGGKVMLHHDEKITILGLPAGTQYIVTENEEPGWTVMPEDRDLIGTITASQKATAYFLNTKGTEWTTTALTVTKYVVGEIDPDETFSVTVTLTPPAGAQPISGTYGEMTFTNNRASFELSHNQTMAAWDLPLNTAYVVEETDAHGHTVRYEGRTGTLDPSAIANAFIYNTDPDTPTPPDDPDTPSSTRLGNLRIAKMVPGSTTTDTEFMVQVSLSGTGSRLNGTYGDLRFTNGVATFTLTNGQSKTATNLPAGIRYSVTETDTKGYQVSYLNQEGTIVRNQTTEAVVINRASTSADNGHNLIVQKRWVLDNGGTRTNSVTVQLLKNGQVESEVTLNARNNWAYTWENLDDNATWSVRENNVPSGFTSSVSHISNFWIVTNDDNDPSSVGPGTSGSRNDTTNSSKNTNNTTNRSNPPTAAKTDFLKWGVTMAAAGETLLWILKKKKCLKR